MTSDDQNNSQANLKKLILKAILAIVILVLIIIGLATLVKEPIIKISNFFVDYLGIWGVAGGILVSDALPAFMIPDAFLVFAIAADLPSIKVILLCTLGSIIGGSLSYLEGRYIIPKLSIGRKFLHKHEKTLIPYIRKYGIWAVVLAALTPLPYSWMCIVTGTFKMNYSHFLLASLARLPRFAIYYYAIKLGWVDSVV